MEAQEVLRQLGLGRGSFRHCPVRGPAPLPHGNTVWLKGHVSSAPCSHLRPGFEETAAVHLNSWKLSFLICEMDMRMPSWQSCWKDQE